MYYVMRASAPSLHRESVDIIIYICVCVCVCMCVLAWNQIAMNYGKGELWWTNVL